MSIMYLAKINLNSRIFDVYRDELKISDVTDRVYKNLIWKRFLVTLLMKSTQTQWATQRDMLENQNIELWN